MRKVLSLFFIIIIAVSLLSGCSGDDYIIEIDDSIFGFKVRHILLNPDDYVGRTVRYEGLFQTQHCPTTGSFYMVNRSMAGCCGGDGYIGFEVYLGDIEPPPNDAQVEVYGTFELYEVELPEDAGGGEPLLILRVAVESLTEVAEG